MNFQNRLLKIVFLVLILPWTASALVMRPNGPEPVIVQIKESLRLSDDLDIRLNELATARQQNRMTVGKWWAGSKLLVMLNFPSNYTERQATAVIAKMQQLPVVEKVVPVSAQNLYFKSGDFVRAYGASDTIPDVARRGFDADRIGKTPKPAPSQAALLRTPHAPNRLIVGWKEEYIWKADSSGFSQTMADFHRNAGCRVVNELRYSAIKLHQVLEFDDPTTLHDKLQRYIDSGYVVFAQPDYAYEAMAEPNDPFYPSQWTLPIIHAPQAWDVQCPGNVTCTGDPSVIVAVGDSGANVRPDSGHPEFTANLWSDQNNGEVHNFVNQSTNVDDDLNCDCPQRYHGTRIASIVGAQGNNGYYMSGVAWDTSLMILKIVDSTGVTYDSRIAQAIMYAADHGATAINLSVGHHVAECYLNELGQVECPEGNYDDGLVRAMNYAKNHNMVVICAAGNDAGVPWPRGSFPPDQTDNDFNLNKVSPASIPTDNNVSVLATRRDEQKASYSCLGKYRVDLGAPGGEREDPVPALLPDGFGSATGTSAAAPHVTGAAALVKSKFPWEDNLGIRDRILMGTDRTGTLEGMCRTNGRLNLYKALQTRSTFRNLSTRARVEDGDRVMIAGFVIRGNSDGPPLKVCIRGRGPSVPVNVDRLGNPVIELHKPDGTVETNDNWADDSHVGETVAYGLQPPDGNEATMIRSLPPGAYTVILRDAGNQFGVGLFEIFELEGNTNEQSRLVNLSTRCLVGVGDNAGQRRHNDRGL